MAIFIGRRPETAFTRVPNEWARDPKLSFKAKGLLTYLLSHQDGYRLTVEQVVAEATDGKAAVYSAIKELVEHGYVERVQRRGERGKVGEVDYYVADAPDGTASWLSASGKPESGDDLGKQDETAGGTAFRFSASGESTTKKTRVKKTKVLEDQNTISLSARNDEPAGPPTIELDPVRERAGSTSSEEPKSDKPTGTIAILLGEGLAPDETPNFMAWADGHLPGGSKGPGWYVTANGNKTLKDRIEDWRASGAVVTSCPDCGDTGQTGDWMNPRECDCIWWKDPVAARKTFKEKLKDFPDCEHGVAGGDQQAPTGWRYCALCRGPGFAEADLRPSGNQGGGYVSPRVNATNTQRSARAPTRHVPFQNPPIEAYHGDL